MGVRIFYERTIIWVYGDMLANVTGLMIPWSRWLVWGYSRTWMNRLEWLSIIHFRGRRDLRKTVIENTEINNHLCLPARQLRVYTDALSIFIRLILFFACSTLNCSLSLSFVHYKNPRVEQKPHINTHCLYFLHFSLQFLVLGLVFYIFCASCDAGSKGFAFLPNRRWGNSLKDLTYGKGLRWPRGWLAGHDGEAKRSLN